MEDKIFTREPCDAVAIKDWPNLKGISVRLPGQFPLILQYYINTSLWDPPQGIVRDPRNQYFLIPIKQINNQIDPAEWDIAWQSQQYPNRWNLADLVEEFGSQKRADWEAGPFPNADSIELFRIVLEAARDQISLLHVEDKMLSQAEVTKLFNAIVDITLILVGSDINVQFEDIMPIIQEQSHLIWRLITCRFYTSSRIDWYNGNDEAFLATLKQTKGD